MFAAQIAANTFRHNVNKPLENFDLHLSANRFRLGDQMQRKVLTIQDNNLKIQAKQNLIVMNGGDQHSLAQQTNKLTLDNLYDWSLPPRDNLNRFSEVEAQQKAILNALDVELDYSK